MKAKTPLFLFVSSIVLAGCFAPATEDCTSTGTWDFEGQELRVLDHGAFDYMFSTIKPIFEAQTKATLVQVQGEDAGGALQRAKEARGNPVADVIYGIDNALLGEAVRADILEPYESPAAAKITLDLEPFRRRGQLVATPSDYGFIGVNYDRVINETVPEADRPKTLKDLASPRWAAEFVVSDPRLSSPGLGFLIATVGTFGENDDYDYLDYWGELFDNGVLVAKDWTEAYVVHFTAGYGQWEEGHVGDRRIVVSYTTSPAYEASFSEDKKAPSISFEPPKGVFRQVETVAILKCTERLHLAQRFVDFVLSEPFQEAVSANMAMYPVVADAGTLPEFQTIATPPQKIIPAPVSQDSLDRNLARWLSQWTDLYQERRA